MVDAKTASIEKVTLRFKGHPVRAVKQRVTREAVNATLEKFGFTGELDLLSIDIDGMDYWVWEAVSACTPRVVAIEYNWLFGADLGYMFGDKVKETPLDSLLTRDGLLLGEDGLNADVRITERGLQFEDRSLGERQVHPAPEAVHPVHLVRVDPVRAVQAQADVEVFLREEFAPFVVQSRAIGLNPVDDFLAHR